MNIVANTTSQQSILDGLVQNVIAISAEEKLMTIQEICELTADIAIHNPEMYASTGSPSPEKTNDPSTDWKQTVEHCHSDPQWNADVDWLGGLDEQSMVEFLLDSYKNKK